MDIRWKFFLEGGQSLSYWRGYYN